MIQISDVLKPFWERVIEGVWWCILEDGKPAYEGLVPIEEGDHLTIFDRDGNQIFDGIVEKDTTTGRRPFPRNPHFEQQFALGRWVHWIQRGYAPDDWAALFFQDPPLRATLRRATRQSCGDQASLVEAGEVCDARRSAGRRPGGGASC